MVPYVCRGNLRNKTYQGAQEEKKAELKEHLTCLCHRCPCLQKFQNKLSNSDQDKDSPAAMTPEICAHISLKLYSQIVCPFAF